MPNIIQTILVTVPANQAALSREGLEKAIDQLVIDHIDVIDTEITETCVDAPKEENEP